VEERRAKRVMVADMLELGHLCNQLRESGHRGRELVRAQVETLREARNTLAHIEPLLGAEARVLLDLLDSLDHGQRAAGQGIALAAAK
jgi:hypothetical protein